MKKVLSMATLASLVACSNEEGIKAFNSNPEGTITSHSDGAELTSGEQISFRGSVSDPNNATNQLIYTWFADAVTGLAVA